MKISVSYLAFGIISVILVVTNFYFFPGNILSWDVFGYYMYLPMIFIYDNWGLQNTEILHKIIETYNSSSTLYQAYVSPTGQWMMRYPMGLAVLYSPFFFIGHLAAGFTDFPKDGFSLPYQCSILIGGIIYSIIGFYFLRKVLLKYFSDNTTALTLLILFLGTNLFWHSGFHGTNAMPHNYLFSLYAILIWLIARWYETYKSKFLYLGGVLCGLIILSRPSEIVCLLLPLLWKVGTDFNFKSKLMFLSSRWKQLLIFGLILGIIGMPQFLYWKIVAGKFLFNSYGDNPGEGFEFLNPFLAEVLFSFRKGWLIYTPVMVFAVAGIYISLKKRLDFAWPATIFFVLNLYIVSSWSCWWYAESFSQRSLVQSYAVMSLPLGAAIGYFVQQRKVARNLAFSLLIVFTCLNLFQSWQFLEGIIHASRMTKEAYFSVFLKPQKPGNFDSLLMIDRSAFDLSGIDSSVYIKTKEFTENFETDTNAGSYQIGQESKAYKLLSPDQYSGSVKKLYSEITSRDHALLKISARVYIESDSAASVGSLVSAIYHKGYSYGYRSVDIENLKIPAKEWTTISLIYLTPVIRNVSDELKVYYWQRGHNPVYVDDLKVEVWEHK